MADQIFNQFLLPNSRLAMPASLREIIDFINRYLPAGTAAEDIDFKVEIIVTELLTNALKHVKNAETLIRIYIDDNTLTIEKTDFGTPFNPNNFIEILTHPAGYKALLTKDDLNAMYAIVESDNMVRFVCEESDDSQSLNLDDVMEHFGLLIITKSAEEFTYHFDSASGLNTFNVRLKLS
jgi:two-component sensor histidine kinase